MADYAGLQTMPDTEIASIAIPAPNGERKLSLLTGRSTIFVGANGAGKTRLGVFIEAQLKRLVRRISAHRSLEMPPKIQAMSLERALRGLEFGYPDEGGSRDAHRWRNDPAITLLSDFEYLLQALFAQQNRTAVEHLEHHRTNPEAKPPETILSKIKTIWHRLLPHRRLHLLELGLEVLPPGVPEGKGYAGIQMSDGERVIFYLLGHCLIAPPNSIMIIDEPELHIHKAILGRLWDAIEAERPDCAFIYVTHDLDFVVARPTAAKFVVYSFEPPRKWEIEELPSGTELPDRVISELVGSRQPVLFVEGERGSVDATIYRGVYANFLVQPIGSCEAVVHAVASFRRNAALHRIGLVSGCIDSDARAAEEIVRLQSIGVYALPVAEVENIMLLPDVFREIAKELHFSPEEIVERLEQLTDDVVDQCSSDREATTVRYTIRRLDGELKKLAPSAKSIAALEEGFATSISSVDVRALADAYKEKLDLLIASRNLAGILACYDNKGLLSLAAKHLGLRGREGLTEYVGRLLAGRTERPVLQTLRALLPNITT